MPLTHVCEWDPEIGYKRISIDEACKKYPYGVSARQGIFACELCAQKVVLTAKGLQVRHFRHDSASVNKECEERQLYFDPSYGKKLQALNGHTMPLKITVKDGVFTFHVGFFRPPEASIKCKAIRIKTENGEIFEYSFERVEEIGTTYLRVGNTPSTKYSFEYLDANDELKNYWATSIDGVKESGIFFDAKTGCMLQAGGKAYLENTYYLLIKRRITSIYSAIKLDEVARLQTGPYTGWYLYRVEIVKFSEYSAQFFLRYSIFLTAKPTKIVPLWPPYYETPYYIHHNSKELFLYLSGDDAVLKAYPNTYNMLDSSEGSLYRLFTNSKVQLVSLGKGGSLGFSYLLKGTKEKEAPIPNVLVKDSEGIALLDESSETLPKEKRLYIEAAFDGKVVVKEAGSTTHVYCLKGGQPLTIEKLAFGMECSIYQGCDLVKILRFEKPLVSHESTNEDEEILNLLKSCRGPEISVPHSAGSIVMRFAKYPRTCEWIKLQMRRGKITRKSLNLMIRLIEDGIGEE